LARTVVSETPPSPADVAAVQARHERELLRYPNVVGVATGTPTRRGQPTAGPALLVLVSRKVPESELAPAERLPREIEGVPVDVVATGPIEPL
jgi:hypothetical protein